MIRIPSFLINFVAFRILRFGLGWLGNTIVGVGVGVGVSGGVSVVDDLSVPLLPEQVLIEILVRLPVISLLRFKSVCKSWRDLIQSSFFIHLHTTTTFNSSSSSSSSCSMFGDPNTFILQISPLTSPVTVVDNDNYHRLRRERIMFMLSFGSGSGSGDDDIEDDDDQVVFKMDNLGLPPYYYNTNMVGSCNGLICLHDVQLRNVYLWNPATRQFRILPKSITIQEEEKEEKDLGIFIAFGFDVKTKDYKVVQINCRIKHTGGIAPQWLCRVQVYSLSTDSWRLLEGINSLPADPDEDYLFNHGVYLNGSYFFVGRKRTCIQYQGEISHDCLMLSFDFTKEIFTTIQLPVYGSLDNVLLTHLGDKIALFAIGMKLYQYQGSDVDDDFYQPCYYQPCYDNDYEYYDIWVLDEQGGGKESWVKLHSLQIKKRVARVRIIPRGILNNGEFALIETKTQNPDGALIELHLLNLVTKELVKSFPIRVKVSRANIYKQSLVSIIGGNGNGTTAATNRVVGGAMIPIVKKKKRERSKGPKVGRSK